MANDKSARGTGTNDARNPKHEGLGSSFPRISSFGFLSDLVIRLSDVTSLLLVCRFCARGRSCALRGGSRSFVSRFGGSGLLAGFGGSGLVARFGSAFFRAG